MGQHKMIATIEESNRVLDEVHQELRRSERKFPSWPDDIIHGGMIMAEESGEAVRACLQVEYENGQVAAYRKELLQTAAMAVRAIVDLDRRKP